MVAQGQASQAESGFAAACEDLAASQRSEQILVERVEHAEARAAELAGRNAALERENVTLLQQVVWRGSLFLFRLLLLRLVFLLPLSCRPSFSSSPSSCYVSLSPVWFPSACLSSRLLPIIIIIIIIIPPPFPSLTFPVLSCSRKAPL